MVFSWIVCCYFLEYMVIAVYLTCMFIAVAPMQWPSILSSLILVFVWQNHVIVCMRVFQYTSILERKAWLFDNVFL